VRKARSPTGEPSTATKTVLDADLAYNEEVGSIVYKAQEQESTMNGQLRKAQGKQDDEVELVDWQHAPEQFPRPWGLQGGSEEVGRPET